MVLHVLKFLVLCFLMIGLGRAQIAFEASHEISNEISGQIEFAVAVDMDGDGDRDVLIAERLGVRVLWYENDGSGNFGAPREWMWGDAGWEVIGLEDWNGDEVPDVW